ncbi:uncharacterized protein MICPUCDRAFT_60771 [Micromonas pusilla CCMP1545]|uniref:Predicted protein n=1 Tax=Micromonas pusilla (strain CCMP1545) TaxID=564608 RepID=C1MZL3_MICPC|nr:uncharacterized protein MICPUCDRAFT_60771 [Micromonas pusilla CCMP1545]EEH54623.1 predicted protein [Micromonas pusilla CCMP1545]|eukprot:XP_003060973.1 predicted protein [Micromonas pusilla CCMP1545]
MLAPSLEAAARPPRSTPADAAGTETATQHIYVLKLEDDCFYVGKTTDVRGRLEKHRRGCNTWAWTAKHKPIPGDDAIYFVETMTEPTAEDAITERMMCEYGIDKVRGGTFSKPNLPEHQAKTLKDKWCTWTDSCFVCREAGHKSINCRRRKEMVRRDLEEAREREEHARAEDELLFSFDNLSVSHTSHPKNSGKKWTEEEKEQLAREKREGKTNEEIAGIHERSVNAIYMQWNKQKPRDSL